ncbi:unnamed protein product [Somion occarium]|uniref:Uncharacterized protein n=1 Tax=Somion occarium TaxID=3059160 RepID=A0ABP1CPZ4_9APHY
MRTMSSPKSNALEDDVGDIMTSGHKPPLHWAQAQAALPPHHRSTQDFRYTSIPLISNKSHCKSLKHFHDYHTHNMSDNKFNFAGTNPFAVQQPPEHHIHRDSEPLPGAGGVPGAAPDYDATQAVTNESREWQPNHEKGFGAGSETGAVVGGGQHSADPDDAPFREQGRDAFIEARPLDVKPTERGGVAIGGQDDLPEGHAKFADKVIGKTQKVAGKVMNKPELHEKGELREAGGKEAVLGQAQAPHD